MESILKNDFVEFFVDKQNYLLNDVWSDATKNMSEDEFKKNLKIWRDLCIEFCIKLSLIDTRNMEFPIYPELQMWIVENIVIPTRDNGLVKSAFLVPNEFITNLSIEQVADETNAVGTNLLQTKYFSQKVEAINWLLCNDN